MLFYGSKGLERNTGRRKLPLWWNVVVCRSHSEISPNIIISQPTSSAIFTIGLKIDGSGGMERNLCESQKSVALQCRNVIVCRSHSEISLSIIFRKSTSSAVFTIGLKIDGTGRKGWRGIFVKGRNLLSCSTRTSSFAGATLGYYPHHKTAITHIIPTLRLLPHLAH